MAHAPFLFSLHPQWARSVFDGHKTLEVRKRFLAPAAFPALAAVYATGPQGAVVGMVRATGLHRVDRADLAGPLAASTQVPPDALARYLGAQGHAVVVSLARPQRFATPFPLTALRAIGHTPPQLATFLSPQAWDVLASRPVLSSQGTVWAFRPVDPRSLALDDAILARPRALYAPAFDAWWAKVQDEGRPCWGVDVDGALSALAVVKRTAPGQAQLCLFHAAVHGQGLGTFLLDRLLATLRLAGVDAVCGEVLATEKATQAWFTRKGFVLTEAPGLPAGHRGLHMPLR